jgi:hypothetical protein
MTALSTLKQVFFLLALLPALSLAVRAAGIEVIEDDNGIKIRTPEVEAVIRKKSSRGLTTYAVSGVAATSFLDRKTGFREQGFGLDIVDWLMEAGSDEAYRDRLDKELIYHFNNDLHAGAGRPSAPDPGQGLHCCHYGASLLSLWSITMEHRYTTMIGIAVTMEHRYTTAAPGKKTGSLWQQTLVFPKGQRYFLSCDKITSANDSDGLFLRLDMPGHIRHKDGDTFSEVYLSYHGRIPSTEFLKDFAPDEKFLYQRGKSPLPRRFIRAYHLRDAMTGKPGPWLAGMTLQPDVVSEAWCHQRGYVCLIEEFGGRPIKAGGTFSAAFVVGYFDSVEEMNTVFDRHAGHTGLEVSAEGWKLVR